MYIVGAILAFSVLVLVHELGHFTLAKINGVKVEQFSIGMGPKLFGIKGKETEYLIKALPIGGYVKMLGEEEAVNDTRALTSKTPLQRLSIIAAGPIMNFVLAIVAFAIIGSRGYMSPTISEILPGKPAEQVGLKAGDKIVKVDNSSVSLWDEVTNKVISSKGEAVKLTIERNGERKDIKVAPVEVTEEGKKRYMVGISPTKVENPSFGESVKYGVSETKFFIALTGDFFKSAFKGKMSVNDVGGPVTIIKVSGKVAQAGIWPLINFVGFLSVQLAIFNILPIPALDGGWILMILVEMITKKKLSDDKVGIINTIGFILLMTLMVLVTIKDILIPVKF